ncbi:MAG: T9SS type A sorting domain-containing protein [Chitinophagales bacterium]|nr:T9SS type A sorting domain-containing protein [Chitinophagales bacterium]
MKKSILLSIAFFFVFTTSKAQTVMQLNGLDCNGNSHDLLADLDAGKAVVVFFYMPNCGSCPPPAKKVQAMADNVNAMHPGMVVGYVMPYNNSTTCAAAASWVTTNAVPFFAPYDSGAVQVANYGGFGMPTVVLLGGTDHRVMFSTLSFSTADTTQMRDSIMALLESPSAITNLPNTVSSFSVFPNPASNNVSINLDLKETSNIIVDVTDIAGKQVAIIMNEKQSGVLTKQFNTASLPNGNYFVRLQVNGKTATQKLSVAH